MKRAHIISRFENRIESFKNDKFNVEAFEAALELIKRESNSATAIVRQGAPSADVLLAEKYVGCSGCDHYYNNYSETFGEEPHCTHTPKPKNIDAIQDYEENCEVRETKTNKLDTDKPSK